MSEHFYDQLEFILETSQRDEVLITLMEHYSGETYGDYQWMKTSGGWTTPKIDTLYGSVCKKFPHLAPLSMDPGFITHLPEFFEHFSDEEINNMDFKEVRYKLKEALGTKTMWRAAALTEQDAQKVLKDGIQSAFLRNKEHYGSTAQHLEVNILSTYIQELSESHFHHENRYSPFISTTGHKDIALQVAKRFLSPSRNNHLYLFELEIPVIDLLHFAPHALRKPGKYPEYWDVDMENYVYFCIGKDEIKNVQKL